MSPAREGELGDEAVQGRRGVCYAQLQQAVLGIVSRQVMGWVG